jgi:hypothetical protein
VESPACPHRAPTTSSRTAERRSPTRRIPALPTFLAGRGLRGPVARAALRVGARVVQDPLGHTLARHLVANPIARIDDRAAAMALSAVRSRLATAAACARSCLEEEDPLRPDGARLPRRTGASGGGASSTERLRGAGAAPLVATTTAVTASPRCERFARQPLARASEYRDGVGGLDSRPASPPNRSAARGHQRHARARAA